MTLIGSTVAFQSTVTGGGNSLEVTGDAVFGDSSGDIVSGVSTLTVSGQSHINTTNVTTTGAQTYTGALTIGENATLQGASIEFSAMIDADSAANNRVLTLDSSGTITFSGSIGSVQELSYLRLIDALILDSATAISMPGADFYIDAPSANITLAKDLSVKGFYFYRGMLDLAGKTVTTSANGDFVAFGAGYDPDDDDRPSGSAQFAYPGILKLGGAPTGVDPNQAAFADLVGAMINVGRSFYVNGADLGASGPWTISLPTSDSVSYYLAGPWGSRYAVYFNGTVAFGQAVGGRIAAASSEAGRFNNRAVRGIGMPAPDAAGLSSGFDFTSPYLVSVETIYDDLLKLTFNEPIENSTNEINDAIKDATRPDKASGRVWASSSASGQGDLPFAAAFIDPDCQTSTDGNGDRSEFYLRISGADSNRWNTDATGSSPGAVASTDRGRPGVPPAHRTTIPDLSFLKGVFADANARNLARGYNYDPAKVVAFPLFDGTVDKTRPALVEVRTGQAVHNAPYAPAPNDQKSHDAHNFIELRYSEPVDLGTSLPAGLTVENVRSETSPAAALGRQGDITEETPGKLKVWGYLETTGGLAARGSTSGGASANAFARDAATPHKARVYLAGYAELLPGPPSARWFWPGWIDGPTMPSGPVEVLRNDDLVDAAGNPVEPTDPLAQPLDYAPSYPRYTVNVDSSELAASDYGGWDTYAPDLAAVRDVGAWGNIVSYEVVPVVPSGETRITRIEFHVLDNGFYAPIDATADDDMTKRWATLRGWISSNGGDQADFNLGSFFGLPDSRGGARIAGRLPAPVPSSAPTSGGIRDTSLSRPGAVAAFSFRDASATGQPYTNGYNLAAGPDAHTFVGSRLFDPTGSIDVGDDPYFGIPMNYTMGGYPWTTVSTLLASYDETVGRVTDLAGNLLKSFTDHALVERIAPRFRLSLARNSTADVPSTKVYVQFTERVNADAIADPATFLPGDLFEIQPPALGLTVVDVDKVSLSELMLTLNRPLGPEDLLTGRLAAKLTTVTDPVSGLDVDGSYIVDLGGNPLDPSEQRRLTDLALGLFDLVAASDGSHGALGLDSPASALPPSQLGLVRDFSGGEASRVLDRDLKLFGAVDPGASSFAGRPTRLYFDVAPAAGYGPNISITGWTGGSDFWLPDLLPGFNLLPNREARSLNPAESLGLQRNFLLPASDPEVANGAELGLLLSFGDLFAARVDPTTDDPRAFDLYRLKIQDLTRQRGGVTIVNNIINPGLKERVAVQVELGTAGSLTVTVFTLDGDVVKRLYDDRQGAGTYTYFWDGTTIAGDAVARGTYFVRVVAPGIDEIRKVLVVK